MKKVQLAEFLCHQSSSVKMREWRNRAVQRFAGDQIITIHSILRNKTLAIQFTLGSFPAVIGKMFQLPANGRRFSSGTARFSLTIALATVVLVKFS